MISAKLKKSYRDLSRRKARTFFTSLTVALGVTGLALFAVTPLADKAVESEIKEQNVNNISIDVDDVALNAKQIKELEAIENVKEFEPRLFFRTKIKIGKRTNSAIVAGNRDFKNQNVDKVLLTSSRVPKVGEALVEEGNDRNGVFKKKSGIFSVINFAGETKKLKIVGEGKSILSTGLTSQGTAVFYTSLATARNLSNTTGYNSLSFTVDKSSTKQLEKTVERIRSYLVANTSVVAFSNLPDLRVEGDWGGREIFEILVNLMGILGFVILFVSVFLISSTMNTIISEQKREIAQMKALGATRVQIFSSYLTTSAILGLMGASFGAVLGVFVSHYVLVQLGSLGFGFDIKLSVHWPTIFVSMGVGLAAVILASLPALRRSTKISVIEGLESHGISSKFGTGLLDRAIMRISGVSRIVQMGIRNAIRKKGRSASTIAQIAFAVGIVLAMLALGDAIISITQKTYDDLLFDLQVNIAENPGNPVTADKKDLLEEIKGVKSSEPFMQSSFTINKRVAPTFGVIRKTKAYAYQSTLLDKGEGRWWTKKEAENRENVVVVGTALAKYEDLKIGDKVKIKTANGSSKFKVIGIDSSFMWNGQTIYLPLETMQKVLRKNDMVSGFYIWTSSSNRKDIDRVSTRIPEELIGKGQRADVIIHYVAKRNNISQNQAMSSMFMSVSFIVVFITLIGLTSTLVMNILDRIREIGMLRCIGAKSRDIRRVFRSEGVFLALIGWVVGVPVGFGLSKIINYYTADAMKLSLPDTFPLGNIFFSFFLTILATIIIIIPPLRRAARFKPGDALRYE